MRIGDFKVLTFDCYGTLIDWESGLFTALGPLLDRARPGVTRDEALEAFARLESAQQAQTPSMRYSDLLAAVHGKLAESWGVAPDAEESRRFGQSIPDWPAFPDSAEALAELKRRHKLVILSNVDRQGFTASNRRLKVEFDAVYTAEDIGSYKPDARNFAHMLDRLAAQGYRKPDILHVAQSLFHDHVPAQAAGLTTVWIDRRQNAQGSGATMPAPGARYWRRYPSMAEFAAADREEEAAG